MVNTLREWKAACPKVDTGKKDESGEPIMALDLVFPNGHGHVEELHNWNKRFWTPLQDKCELAQHFDFHTLRHVAASLFIQYLGWTPKRLQVVMGHSSITITFDLYGHLFEDKAADREAMKKIEAAIVAA